MMRRLFEAQPNWGLSVSIHHSVGWEMGTKVLLAAVIGASLLSFSAGGLDQSAPFGFSWGPVDKVPTPSLASREDNITFLFYRGDRLPPDELRDTEEIVLEVCKREGLQQIVWVSRFLSASEEHDKLGAILAEGIRRYGEPEIAEQGLIRWSAGRTMAATTSNDRGLGRIIMVSTGPGFDACSEEHKSLTGHPASDYWMRFLPNSLK
jgi:hypothetical protein